MKTLAQLEKDFWNVFSRYIRMSHASANGYVSCVTCGAIHHWKNMDAGHFISRSHKFTKFNEMNVKPQCKQCNAFKQGAAIPFRRYLVDTYGEDEVRCLEDSRNFPAGFTREGLLLRIQEYKDKVEKLQKNII